MANDEFKHTADKVAERLMALRLEHKLSHEKLGKKAGVHWTTIGMIERGKRVPSIVTAMKICHALDIRLADLLEDIEPQP